MASESSVPLLYSIVTMPLFGNKKTFAIQCSTNDQNLTDEWILICCHLILGEQFIGDPKETDVLGVSADHLEQLRNQVKGDTRNLTHPLFQSLSDIEIFELILKSNQLEEEFDPNFYYLPSLEEEGLFGTHHFYVGESTDAYFLVVIQQSENIKFLWRNLRTKESKTHSVVCSREEVIGTINNCLRYFKNAFPEKLAWLQL